MGLSNDIVYVKLLIDHLKIKMMSGYSFLQWLQSVYSFFVRTMKLISGAHWPIFKSILVEGHSVTTLSITLEGFSFPRHLLAYQTVGQADSDMFHGQDTYSCKKVGIFLLVITTITTVTLQPGPMFICRGCIQNSNSKWFGSRPKTRNWQECVQIRRRTRGCFDVEEKRFTNSNMAVKRSLRLKPSAATVGWSSSFIGMQAAQVSFCHLPVTSAIFPPHSWHRQYG